MAPRTTTSLALFLVLNILFFTLVSACSTCPTPNPKPKPKPKPKPTPTPSKGNCPPPNPNPKPTPTPTPSKGTCPRDALKLNVCANLLGGLIGIGIPQKSNCCSLLGGLTDLDAAICLCLAIQANILGINLNVPLSLSLLLNTCDKKVPTGFQCS